MSFVTEDAFVPKGTRQQQQAQQIIGSMQPPTPPQPMVPPAFSTGTLPRFRFGSVDDDTGGATQAAYSDTELPSTLPPTQPITDGQGNTWDDATQSWSDGLGHHWSADTGWTNDNNGSAYAPAQGWGNPNPTYFDTSTGQYTGPLTTPANEAGYGNRIVQRAHAMSDYMAQNPNGYNEILDYLAPPTGAGDFEPNWDAMTQPAQPTPTQDYVGGGAQFQPDWNAMFDKRQKPGGGGVLGALGGLASDVGSGIKWLQEHNPNASFGASGGAGAYNSPNNPTYEEGNRLLNTSVLPSSITDPIPNPTYLPVRSAVQFMTSPAGIVMGGEGLAGAAAKGVVPLSTRLGTNLLESTGAFGAGNAAMNAETAYGNTDLPLADFVGNPATQQFTNLAAAYAAGIGMNKGGDVLGEVIPKVAPKVLHGLDVVARAPGPLRGLSIEDVSGKEGLSLDPAVARTRPGKNVQQANLDPALTELGQQYLAQEKLLRDSGQAGREISQGRGEQWQNYRDAFYNTLNETGDYAAAQKAANDSLYHGGGLREDIPNLPATDTQVQDLLGQAHDQWQKGIISDATHHDLVDALQSATDGRNLQPEQYAKLARFFGVDIAEQLAQRAKVGMNGPEGTSIPMDLGNFDQGATPGAVADLGSEAAVRPGQGSSIAGRDNAPSAAPVLPGQEPLFGQLPAPIGETPDWAGKPPESAPFHSPEGYPRALGNEQLRLFPQDEVPIARAPGVSEGRAPSDLELQQPQPSVSKALVDRQAEADALSKWRTDSAAATAQPNLPREQYVRQAADRVLQLRTDLENAGYTQSASRLTAAKALSDELKARYPEGVPASIKTALTDLTKRVAAPQESPLWKKIAIDEPGSLMQEVLTAGFGHVGLHGYLTMVTDPEIWAKGIAATKDAAISPENVRIAQARRLLELEDMQPGLSDMARKAHLRALGGGTSGDLTPNILHRIPGVKEVADRNLATYTAGTETWRYEWFKKLAEIEKASKDGPLTQEDVNRLADSANHITFTTTNSAYSGNALMEAALFAPRMLGAMAALPVDAIRGNPGVRRVVLQSMGETFAATAAANLASSGGKDLWGPGLGYSPPTSAEDFSKLIHDPHFMTVRMGDHFLKPLGPFDSPFRFVMNTAADIVQQNPGLLREDAAFFLRSHLSALAGLALDLMTNTDFAGNPLDIKNMILEHLTPISVQDASNIGSELASGDFKSAGASALGFLGGVKQNKMTDYQKYQQQAEDAYRAAGNKGNVMDDPLFLKQWVNAHPDAKPDPTSELGKAIKRINDSNSLAYAANDLGVLNGDKTLDAWRTQRKIIQAGQRGSMDEALRGAKNFGNTPGTPAEWVNSYYDTFTQATKPDKSIDSDKLDELQAQWAQKYGQKAVDYMAALNGESTKGGGIIPDPVTKQYLTDIKTLADAGYFNRDKLPHYTNLTSGTDEKTIESVLPEVTRYRGSLGNKAGSSWSLDDVANAVYNMHIVPDSKVLSVAQDVLAAHKAQNAMDSLGRGKEPTASDAKYLNFDYALFKTQHQRELKWFSPTAKWQDVNPTPELLPIANP